MLAEMWVLFESVVLPVLVVVALGVVVQRFYPLHIPTLTRLNLYVFIPAFLFVRITASTLSWADVGLIGLAVLLPMAIVGLPLLIALRKSGAGSSTQAAVLVGGIFFNAGNFGIPVAELAFPGAGGQVQALVVMFMNTAIFFLGYGILAVGQGKGVGSVLGYFKLPMIYVVIGALILRDTEAAVPSWAMTGLMTIADGMVPIALLTLSAQLASRARWPSWRIMAPVISVKLLAMPAVTAVVVWMLGLWPWPGAQLVLAASAPTAVNTLLITLELEGDADTAAECVFWTTVLSAVTVTITLTVIMHLGGGPP